jgi:hypothetical protein
MKSAYQIPIAKDMNKYHQHSALMKFGFRDEKHEIVLSESYLKSPISLPEDWKPDAVQWRKICEDSYKNLGPTDNSARSIGRFCGFAATFFGWFLYLSRSKVEEIWFGDYWAGIGLVALGSISCWMFIAHYIQKKEITVLKTDWINSIGFEEVSDADKLAKNMERIQRTRDNGCDSNYVKRHSGRNKRLR